MRAFSLPAREADFPFSTWPVQLYDPRFGFAWYTEPCVFVNQLIHSRGTVEVAEGLHDAIDHVLARERASIERHGGLMMIHDWRKMTSYDTEARVAYLARMKARNRLYLRQVVAVLPDRPLVRMAVQTANIVMALSSGGHLRIATQVAPILTELGVHVPVGTGWT